MKKAARNIPGVEVCHVERLNLLQLCPGGHLGRFVIWTKDAFEKFYRGDKDVTYHCGHAHRRILLQRWQHGRLHAGSFR